MPSPKRGTGYGSSLQWTANTMLNDLEMIDLNLGDMSSEVYDATHYGSGAAGASEMGNAEFIAGDVADPGSFEVEYHFNPDKVLPLSGAVDTATLTWKSGAIWVFPAKITNVSGAFPFRGKMVFTMTVKIMAAIAVTPAA
jgi:hypothetical protein